MKATLNQARRRIASRMERPAALQMLAIATAMAALWALHSIPNQGALHHVDLFSVV